MKVIWDKKAQQTLFDTADYIALNFGVQYSVRFIEEVANITALLEVMPYMGQAEKTLRRSKRDYRSLTVGKLNKLIYYIGTDTINIVDVWDTRMNPITLAQRLKKR